MPRCLTLFALAVHAFKTAAWHGRVTRHSQFIDSTAVVQLTKVRLTGQPAFLCCCATALCSLIAACSASNVEVKDSSPIVAQSKATRGSIVNLTPAHEITPLLAAVDSGDEVKVRQLLVSGARSDDPRSARSPLNRAITSFRGSGNLYCNRPIIELLLKYGADPNRPDPMIGALPLNTAIEVGDLPCAVTIRDAGGNVNGRDDRGATILVAAEGAAVIHGDESLIDVAIMWGVDPNTAMFDGNTALHEAVNVDSPRYDSTDLADALLHRGANPCVRNRIGQTPLRMAINLHRGQRLRELLERATICQESVH